MWAKDHKYSSRKDRLNLASMRSCTTPFHFKSLSLDRELGEEFLKEIKMAHRSSIRMLPKNTPPLNPLVKSSWTLNSSFKSGRPSTGTMKHRKLPKGGPKWWKRLAGRLLNSRRSKQLKKVGSPNQESEIGSFRASPIVVSLFSGIRELSTLWMVWGGPYLSFSNLDVRSRFHSYLRNYELRTFNTCVSTYKSRQNSKRGKNKGRNVKWKSKRKLKKKNQYQLSCGKTSSSCPSNFLEDSVKEHTAR